MKEQKKIWNVILMQGKSEDTRIELLYRATNRTEMLKKVMRDIVSPMRIVSARIVKG